MWYTPDEPQAQEVHMASRTRTRKDKRKSTPPPGWDHIPDSIKEAVSRLTSVNKTNKSQNVEMRTR